MTPVSSHGQVFEAIQSVKADASAFCTNFFPVETKLKHWISHGELQIVRGQKAVFLFRKDHDCEHLYFCATDPAGLRHDLDSVSEIRTKPLVADLVGKEEGVAELLQVLLAAGFRKHARLVRLGRYAASGQAAPNGSPRVELANENDSPAVLQLLERNFSRVIDQLPLDYEMALAIAAQQVLVIRERASIAACLHFETQGLSSLLRFWVVDQAFRSAGFGAMLMQHYFRTQSQVRRFILWVNAANENALQKYHHYGYLPDGLADYVLVNSLIHQ